MVERCRTFSLIIISICFSIVFCLSTHLFFSSSLQHARLHAIRQQRDKMMKEGTYTPPACHTGKTDQSPWGNTRLCAAQLLLIVNQMLCFMFACTNLQINVTRLKFHFMKFLIDQVYLYPLHALTKRRTASIYFLKGNEVVCSEGRSKNKNIYFISVNNVNIFNWCFQYGVCTCNQLFLQCHIATFTQISNQNT